MRGGKLLQQFQSQVHWGAFILAQVDSVAQGEAEPADRSVQKDQLKPVAAVEKADKRYLLAGLLDTAQDARVTRPALVGA